ncbi:thiolase family protein [Paraburkholderia sp. BCC1886]|uniref:thiolase family protein n=1 Tax=Paraburkholderia sp. BCC1886 TaxID=2562670 RepID=UPI001183D1FC|nr:thiolase family protein [Paraburkholderia sp. BCC1886]
MEATAFVRGVGVTPYGRLEGSDTLDLMSSAATRALADANLQRGEVDGLLVAYSTTMPHLMLGTVFAEHFGLRPTWAHGVQVGGATGLTLVALASHLVRAGVVKRVLCVAGENRLTGQSRDDSIKVLAQVGHPRYEVPLGASIPAYYALLAQRYLHETGASPADLAELAVLMRANAAAHEGAHLRQPISVADVLASKPVSTPLRLLDCCPISDGGAAVIVDSMPGERAAIRIAGTGSAHTHQHVSMAPDDVACGARESSAAAYRQAGYGPADIDYLGIYDSFTVTLAMLLEATGFSEPGQAGALARSGRFGRSGRLPLNTHGGLLSYGHCGAAGALAHLAEAVCQMRGEAGERQIAHAARRAFLHSDGGVLSSHTSMILETHP